MIGTAQQGRVSGAFGLHSALVVGALLVAIAARGPRAGESSDTAPAKEARAAVERALPLLQSSARAWTNDIKCFSCHHQGLGSIGFALARETGFRIDEEAVRAEAHAVHEYSQRRFDALLVYTGVGVFGRSTTLLALGAADVARDEVTDSVAHFLAARQTASGAWYSNEHRPPIEDSAVSATVLTIRALQLYGPEGRAAEIAERIARARTWLEDTTPENNEERSMRLLGLAWCGSRQDLIAAGARELLEMQCADGGWAQIDTLASDAYATGQALVVLNQAAGMAVHDAAWLRGARFLIDSQCDDGSWFVRTRRRIQGLPQVDSCFPHGENQFVSFAASTWATMALALRTAEPGRRRALFAPGPARNSSDSTTDAARMGPLLRAAAFGSVAELSALLDAGAAADEPGPRGLTALMLAVHDVAKVETLLHHGADPHARSESGFTPLLLAAMTSGARPSLDRLLALGASVDCMGANGATPLFSVASVGELESLRVLLGAGAEFPGTTLQDALVYAACCNDLAMGKTLLALGARLDDGALQGYTALTAAVMSGYGAFVDMLIEAGADLEVRDGEGLTALAWAAKIDPGHTRILQRLLDGGADADSLSASGRRPLDWALEFASRDHVRVLREALQREE